LGVAKYSGIGNGEDILLGASLNDGVYIHIFLQQELDVPGYYAD
jgi:hypothetical protein